MICNACGEKPKKTCNDFTKAVIEIDNPETLVLLRKVVIPASMGAEEQVPPAIGKYHNVILYYEANKHVYLYSSDGIPTLLEMDVPQEIIDRIDTLEDNVDDLNDTIDNVEQEIEDLKNSPDVVDIVATYADLQAYDTSDLGDKDVIRVLTDETHDNESSYYRWNTSTQTWTFIGATGPYYTKGEVDDLLDEKQGALTAGNKISINNDTVSLIGDSITVLTTDDLDYPVNDPDGVAVWKRDPGFYTGNVKKYLNMNTSTNHAVFINSKTSGSVPTTIMTAVKNREQGGNGNWYRPKLFVTYVDTGSAIGADSTLGSDGGFILTRNDVLDSVPSSPSAATAYYPVSGSAVASSVNGIKNNVGDLSTLQTTTKSSAVAAINETIDKSGYSTNEIDTNTKWIDGSPIYKKTIDTGALPNNAMKTVQHGVGTSLDRAIKIEGYAYSPSFGMNMSMPDPDIAVQVAGINIEIKTNTNLSMFTESYVTLYYTKTQ